MKGAPEPSPAGARSLRVLVVDDETVVRMDLRDLLTRLGHRVVGEASTGEDAVSQARELDPDLIFLDLKMPRMNGLDALERLQEERLRPVVVLTAFSEQGLIEKALERGASTYIVKPFDQSTILPAIQVALTHFEQLEALRDENASLKEAVETSRVVERAKSLLVDCEGLSQVEAFRRIQKMSMESNKKMKEVAQAIVMVYSNQ